MINLYEQISKKKPFIYDDGEMLVAISHNKYTFIINSITLYKYDKYIKFINDKNNDKNERLKVFNKLIFIADSSVNLSQHKSDLKTYIEGLTKEKHNKLMEQVETLINLYKELN